MAARPRRWRDAYPDGRDTGPPARDRFHRRVVRSLPGGRPVAARGAIPTTQWLPARKRRRRHAGLGCRRAPRRDRRWRGRRDLAWLVWSNDSGVFPLRNAVERARPSAPVVPAVPRAPDAAELRARTWPVAMEHTRIAQRGGRAGTLGATTATRLPVDRGTTGTCTASAPPAPPAGADPALRRDAPLGICRPRDDGRRSPRRAAAPGTVTVVGARDPDHHRRGSRCRRAAAPGALR